MKRLTVDKAAEQLGISREAVYKRVQRNTLPHMRGEDGRLYVYLDAGQAADGNHSTVDDATGSTTDRRRAGYGSLAIDNLSDFAQISGIVAGLAAAVYVLGLFALWVPIARVYTSDFITAWHEVSLVPRIVVAGLGVRQLVAFPLLIVSLIFFLTLAANWLMAKSRRMSAIMTSYMSVVSSDHDLHTSRGAVVIIPFYLLALVYSAWRITNNSGPASVGAVASMSVLLATGLGSVFCFFTFVQALIARRLGTAAWQAFLSGFQAIVAGYFVVGLLGMGYIFNPGFIITAAIIIIAVFVVTYAAGNLAQFIDAAEGRPEYRSLVPAARPVIISALAAAFLLTTVDKPPLPSVVITRDTELSGKLLTHSDGFWYVFPDEGKHKDQLIAIPDEDVKSTRMSSF